MFSKSLARYYRLWIKDCYSSVEFCKNKGDDSGANRYLASARRYEIIVSENSEAIDFFSIGDRAFLKDEALPAKFRGYK